MTPVNSHLKAIGALITSLMLMGMFLFPLRAMASTGTAQSCPFEASMFTIPPPGLTSLAEEVYHFLEYAVSDDGLFEIKHVVAVDHPTLKYDQQRYQDVVLGLKEITSTVGVLGHTDTLFLTLHTGHIFAMVDSETASISLNASLMQTDSTFNKYEVMAVVMHELGHIVGNHRNKLEAGLCILDSLLVQQSNPEDTYSAYLLEGYAWALLNQILEYDADAFSRFALYWLGISPACEVSLLKKFQPGHTSGNFSGISTHPALEDRIRRAVSEIPRHFRLDPLSSCDCLATP